MTQHRPIHKQMYQKLFESFLCIISFSSRKELGRSKLWDTAFLIYKIYFCKLGVFLKRNFFTNKDYKKDIWVFNVFENCWIFVVSWVINNLFVIILRAKLGIQNFYKTSKLESSTWIIVGLLYNCFPELYLFIFILLFIWCCHLF